ncbi:hypothetical protein ACQ4PT_058796 [Festuca glaucescens]
MAQDLAVLPEDVLVEVLRRLPPHSIAASRWVCKAWRDAVDARLRSHLLSHSIGPAIWGGLDFLPCKGVKVTDHCNGLMLCRDWIHRGHQYVVNPATQRWARLPERPPLSMLEFGQTACLVFDHAVSPQYELWYLDESCGKMKWVLKHDIDLGSFGRKFHPLDYYGQQMDKHWILQDVNYRKWLSCFEHGRKTHGNLEAPAEETYDWNSDDDNIMDTECIDQEAWRSKHIGFLGFHPYKEMVFRRSCCL